MPREPKELTDVKTLQIKILKRYLSKKELEKFLIKYRAHKRGWGGLTRFVNLPKPLTERQRKAVLVYMFDDGPGQSVRQLAEKIGVGYGEFINAVNRGALKILYQNRNKLKLKELLGGGE